MKHVLSLAVPALLLPMLSFANIFPSNEEYYKQSTLLGYTTPRIGPGAGYSDDTQQVTPLQCFNTTERKPTAGNSRLRVDFSKSYKELEKELNIDISTEGSIGMFTFGGEYNYLRNIKDKEYSLSLNYYHYVESKVGLTPAGRGADKILNPLGKSMYANGYNPAFGRLCGNRILTEYKQGGLLIMSVNIDFASKEEKERFKAHAGGSFGDIFSASSTIEQIAKQYQIQGRVAIQAYQKGGEPAKLSGVLQENPEGGFYLTSCSLEEMSKCERAADGLLRYGKHEFSKQIKPDENRGLEPHIDITEFAKSPTIGDFGLIEPRSLVTDEVKSNRLTLANELKKYDYYTEKLDSVVNRYAVDWDKHSEVYKGLSSIFKRAERNLSVILRNPSSPQHNARACFDNPEDCAHATNDILSKITPIADMDLTPLEKIKYYMELRDSPHAKGDNFYYHSDSVNNMRSSKTTEINTLSYNPDRRFITARVYIYITSTREPRYIWMAGSLRGAFPNYEGALCAVGTSCPNRHALVVRINPYYFGPYKPLAEF